MQLNITIVVTKYPSVPAPFQGHTKVKQKTTGFLPFHLRYQNLLIRTTTVNVEAGFTYEMVLHQFSMFFFWYLIGIAVCL